METRHNLKSIVPHMAAAAFAAAALAPWNAFANFGTIEFATGAVTVTGADGRSRPARRGIDLRTGDRIESAADGRAQIRFADGAYVSLQPNTAFNVRDFRFSGRADGNESAFFSLFKGALRTVTGVVGRADRSRYQIETPTATIGIRGTGGLIAIGTDGSTLVTGTSGIWALTNGAGTIDVPAGTAGYAGPDRRIPPRLVDEGPVIPPAQVGDTKPPQQFVQGESLNARGMPDTLFPPLTSGPGYELTGVAAQGAAAPMLPAGPYPVSASYDSSGALTAFTNAQGVTYTLAAGTQPDFGAIDGVLAWGRWTGTISIGASNVTLAPTDGLHYVIGMPSSTIPTGGGTFTYNLIGGTTPTSMDAKGTSTTGVLNSAQLIGDFTKYAVIVTVSATLGGNTYNGLASGTITRVAPITFATVGGTATSPSLTACVQGCTFNVSGSFFGSGATHAGMVYQFSDGLLGTTINGTAGLKR